MVTARPTVLAYCEVRHGIGPWMRLSSIAAALSRRFHVVAVVTTGDGAHLGAPPGVDLVTLSPASHFPCLAGDPNGRAPLGGPLLALLDRVRPLAVLVDFFPFGRERSALYLVPFLGAARRCPGRPLIVTSLHDIGERTLAHQAEFERRALVTANRLIDAVLVHADPGLITPAETFRRASELKAPVYHTGYVASPSATDAGAERRARHIVVSAGGGRGGEPVLRAAIAAQRTMLSPDFTMRAIAGSLLPESAFRALLADAEGVPGLEVVRWVPSLAREMAHAAVSISRCGYNTAIDIVCTNTPAIVVPLVRFEDEEQLFRGEKLEQRGVVRVLSEERLTPEALAAEARMAAARRPPRFDLDVAGAERTVQLIEDLIAKRPTRGDRAMARPSSSDQKRGAPIRTST